MVKNNISTKFQSVLKNGQMPLDERLDMAYGAVISQDFILSNKGQILLDWFAELLLENTSQLRSILKILTKCLSSECFSTLCESVDASKVILALQELDEELKIKHHKQLITNVLLILKHHGCQRHCRFDIQPLCYAAALVFPILGLTSKEDSLYADTVLDEMFELINNIYKITQQRTELKLDIVDYIIPSLQSIKVKIHLSKSLQKLFDEVIFADDIERLCDAFKLNVLKIIPDHYKSLAKLMTGNKPQCDVVALYPLLLDAYTHSLLKTSKTETTHLSLFYILLKVVGIDISLKFETVEASDDIKCKNLTILTELVAILQKHNISTNSESPEGLLTDFLTAILKTIISKEYSLSSDLLKAVNILFNVCPESVRPLFSSFCLHIVFANKSEKILRTYNKLIADVIKIFSRLNQTEKLFSLLFQNATAFSNDGRLSKLSCNMILTEGFYTAISEKLPTLTGNQLNAIIGLLGKTFSKNLATLTDENKCQDQNFCLLVKLIVQVLGYILENSFFIISTRWNLISEEIKSIVDSIQTFGSIILKLSTTEFTLEFLQLVRIAADIEAVINQYVILPSTVKILPSFKSKEKSNKLWNLSKSHGFLPSEDWKRISEIVEESYSNELNHCWYDLLLQKYLRQSDAEVVTQLVLTADADWLWGSLGRLAGCVPLKQLELYTEQLISCVAEDSLTKQLDNINCVSNRPLRTALNFQCLKQMSKMIPDKTALSRTLLKLIDVHSLVKFESEYCQSETERHLPVVTMIDALASHLNTSLWQEPAVEFTDEAREYFQRLIDVINVISPYCLKGGTKRIIFLVLMGLANDFKSEESLLHSIMEIILGCVDDVGSVIPDSLDRRVLLNWMATIVPDSFPLRTELCQGVVDKVVYSLDQSVQEMSQVVQGNSRLLCALLTAFINVLGTRGCVRKEEFNKSLKYLISLATPMIIKKPKAKYIMLFSRTLKAESLVQKETTSSIHPLLQPYLDILFKRLADNSVIEPNSTEVIDLALSMKSELDPGLVEHMYKLITAELCKTELCPLLCYPLTVRAFVESLPADSFEQVLSEIYKHQLQSSLANKELFSISNTCEFWTMVVTSHLDKEKGATRQKMLIRVLEDYQSLLAGDQTRVHHKVLSLLYSITVSKSVTLVPKLLDTVLVILYDMPTDSHSHLLPECLSVMSVLISLRSELMFDRIPAYLQRLRKFVRSLALLSAERADHLVYDSVITSSMNQFTRIIKMITDHHSKHFARIAPYFIADLLDILVTIPVDLSIKEELQNCVCWLLGSCDQHGTQLLQNLLPLATMQTYKVLTTTYQRSFKYTGKV